MSTSTATTERPAIIYGHLEHDGHPLIVLGPFASEDAAYEWAWEKWGGDDQVMWVSHDGELPVFWEVQIVESPELEGL